jgi:parallel beta-helix repeat protein
MIRTLTAAALLALIATGAWAATPGGQLTAAHKGGVTAHGTKAPSPTATASPTPTPSATPTLTPTPTATPTPTPTPTATATPTPTPTPTPPPGCTGVALTSQSQVQPNTSYCGGTVNSAISLATGDTWTNGTASNVNTGSNLQAGVITAHANDTLVNMTVGPNPSGGRGVDVEGNGVTITGGHFFSTSTLGIGESTFSSLTISGIEADHNGTAANCGWEGGGFKGVGSYTSITNSYFHDNPCTGIWFDIDAANDTIANNRVINNGHEGIFYEISSNASIHDNVVTGNGFQTNGNGVCAWLWGGGITLASSYNVNVYNNTVSNNCNAITMTQQNRGAGRILANDTVHNNVVTGGKSGVVQDDGDQGVYTRGNTFSANTYHQSNCGAGLWTWFDAWLSFTQFQADGQDIGSTCGA